MPTTDTLSPDTYEGRLARLLARSARELAENARENVAMTGDVLADLLDALAVIAWPAIADDRPELIASGARAFELVPPFRLAPVRVERTTWCSPAVPAVLLEVEGEVVHLARADALALAAALIAAASR
ncbi:hypothetical protein QN355_06365 [Cryobacterium sp. 10S3]|uniref:hypothetical protein n=1 Tax=Cryobacterium sp. 10S3 TaxID=3048582 RepID=UPI002AC9740C|nr:hypothetical protein [Cryobacterium sp. 10S3]MEB0286172.1 hypothetical protein [Cryobacterium sp. 10S3]WPX12230.1 hypothetical protein RHM57_11105 [Cryobacterium sp. 10S3]